MKHLPSPSFQHKKILQLSALLITGMVGLHMPLLAQNQTGPTPFPDPKNESAWPGTGPIRVFPWMIQNRDYFWTKRDAKQGAVVFVGDSLLGNWSANGAKIEPSFPHVKLVANRAIGGDTSRGVLFRLKEDVLDLHPSAVVFLVGTNDLSAKAPVDGIVSNITAILDETQKAYPDMPIILSNIPPRNSPKSPIDPAQLTQLNERIAQLAQNRPHVTFFDSFSLFAKPDGTPDPIYFRDDLMHPSDAAYAKWDAAFDKVFEAQKIQ